MVIEIKDSGIGLKEDEKRSCSRNFTGAKNEFTKDISGTGLGLSIIKRIVDSYSGKLKWEANLTKGHHSKYIYPLHKTIFRLINHANSEDLNIYHKLNEGSNDAYSNNR